ncbi:MAG: heat-inducible transcriptional repressor HrcA [Dehalococcoidia bacterium]
MLATRSQSILKTIVVEYISRATPVPSEFIAQKLGQRLSPATIRHEMARLEEEGFITRPHISSGGIPSDQGYRYYVESLEEAAVVSAAEQRLIQHLFHQVERRLEEWVQLTAAILARLTGNAALITPPKATESHFKHLDLVRVQEFLALLILVIEETKLKKQLLSMDQAVSQEELNVIAHKLNTAYLGLTFSQIALLGRASRSFTGEGSPLEKQITQVVLQMMNEDDETQYEEPHLHGIRHILEQPEFAQSRRVLNLIDLLEGGNILRNVLSQAAPGEGVKVIIGQENKEESLRDLSLIITHYGVPAEARGIIGVVGPTRMHYGHNISRVRYMSSVMSQLLNRLHGEATPQRGSSPHPN